jgi:hypothetical protein
MTARISSSVAACFITIIMLECLSAAPERYGDKLLRR